LFFLRVFLARDFFLQSSVKPLLRRPRFQGFGLVLLSIRFRHQRFHPRRSYFNLHLVEAGSMFVYDFSRHQPFSFVIFLLRLSSLSVSQLPAFVLFGHCQCRFLLLACFPTQLIGIFFSSSAQS
jgi:hypothetical protein